MEAFEYLPDFPISLLYREQPLPSSSANGSGRFELYLPVNIQPRCGYPVQPQTSHLTISPFSDPIFLKPFIPVINVSMMTTFTSTFSGAPGEDPEEYLEKVEVFGMRVAPNDNIHRKKEITITFRSGLRDRARQDWYLKLLIDKRKWGIVEDLFRKRFQIRETDFN